MMIEVQRTGEFDRWLEDLRDRMARARILVRIRRMELGNPGDLKSVGGGVSEMRIDHGPGYRVYLAWQGEVAVLLLCGGDKASQRRDIVRAQQMAKEI